MISIAKDRKGTSRRISGAIVLPYSMSFSGAAVVVRVLDVAQVDVRARVVAETSFPFSGGPTGRIPFELRLEETITASSRVTLSAEIRTKTPKALKAGDWLTTRSYGVSPAAVDAGTPFELAVERVKG